MTWEVERTAKFERGYAGLSYEAQRRCDGVVDELSQADDPRRLGERLSGVPYFKYRFGDYRLIYNFSRKVELLELYDVGKRSRIYD